MNILLYVTGKNVKREVQVDLNNLFFICNMQLFTSKPVLCNITKGSTVMCMYNMQL